MAEVGGVVDGRLRVRDTSGLRVVDASVVPLSPAALLESVVTLVAERGADLIKEDWGARRGPLPPGYPGYPSAAHDPFLSTAPVDAHTAGAKSTSAATPAGWLGSGPSRPSLLGPVQTAHASYPAVGAAASPALPTLTSGASRASGSAASTFNNAALSGQGPGPLPGPAAVNYREPRAAPPSGRGD